MTNHQVAEPNSMQTVDTKKQRGAERWGRIFYKSLGAVALVSAGILFSGAIKDYNRASENKGAARAAIELGDPSYAKLAQEQAYFQGDNAIIGAIAGGVLSVGGIALTVSTKGKNVAAGKSPVFPEASAVPPPPPTPLQDPLVGPPQPTTSLPPYVHQP